MLPFENKKRTVIEKIKAETSDKFGKRPEERTPEELIQTGIVNVDKPEGPSSHEVSAYVQKILHLKKAGHSGTLDPGVTGVLPVALARSTKIVQILLPAGKEYICVMHVHADLPEGKIRDTIKNFVGKITQLPPVRSAIKRVHRERNIYYADILEIEGRDVLMKVGCEAGTYIRKLCHDIGVQLGVGANMAELRRTKAGPFDETSLSTLHDLIDAYWFWKNENNDKLLRKVIQPMENATKHLPKIWIMDTTVDSLAHGATLNLPGIAKFESGIEKDDFVAVMTLKGELVCYGKSHMTSDEMKDKEKGIAVTILRVFIEPGIYPKMPKK
ncbi:MAG: RNA-guided pseudouridylation complex pseudouridine synthase subunit Cbf5 [Nanoarchaeota archaeon]|nr:MAG: RNA-guided pseudouridylation complex pseudouridine synthase subunit Cbf5 [Nanoarchaeota archaeon]